MDFADCDQWRPRWPTSKNVRGEEFEVMNGDVFVSFDGRWYMGKIRFVVSKVMIV
jgi:hypothetical protein